MGVGGPEEGRAGGTDGGRSTRWAGRAASGLQGLCQKHEMMALDAAFPVILTVLACPTTQCSDDTNCPESEQHASPCHVFRGSVPPECTPPHDSHRAGPQPPTLVSDVATIGGSHNPPQVQ